MNSGDTKYSFWCHLCWMKRRRPRNSWRVVVEKRRRKGVLKSYECRDPQTHRIFGRSKYEVIALWEISVLKHSYDWSSSWHETSTSFKLLQCVRVQTNWLPCDHRSVNNKMSDGLLPIINEGGRLKLSYVEPGIDSFWPIVCYISALFI